MTLGVAGAEVLRALRFHVAEEVEMPTKFHRLSVKDLWGLSRIFWAVIALGTGFRLFFPVYRWWPYEGVYPLADAFIVAGIVGTGLELCAEKYLLERVASELSDRLVGRGLPKQLQGVIGGITQTSLVRENYIKRYRFGAPVNGKIELDVSITFDVLNYSDTVRETLI